MEDNPYFQRVLIRERSSFLERDCLESLSPLEREQYAQIHPLKRDDYLMGRLTLKELLVAYYGRSPLFYEILFGDNGSPHLENIPGLYCSISHSKEHIAALISGYRGCGVDIEEKKIRSDAFAKYILTSNEKSLLSKQFPLESIATIAWCAKEAAVKSDFGKYLITDYQIENVQNNEIELRRDIFPLRVFIEMSDNYIYAYGHKL